jgi:hypothetical protein
MTISRRSLMRGLFAAILAPAAGLATTGEAEAQWGPPPGMRHGPPPPRVEVRPRARRGYVWIPGHWVWRHGRYVWVSGRFVRARPGWRYRNPRWVWRNGRWVFVAGGWVRV